MDDFHVFFRKVIDGAWRNLAGQQAFKDVAIDFEMASWGMEEFSLENQILNKMSCGVSANRMCELLTNDPMKDIMTSSKAVDLSEKGKVTQALSTIQKSPGYTLVRINVSGGGAGHAYIFLSNNRKPADPIDGHIYQTNVGCHRDNAFGLNTWVNDPRSSEVVNLPSHIKDLAENLCGVAWSEDSLKAADFYQQNYMLSGKTLKQGVRAEIEEQSQQASTRATARFMWAPVQVAVARKNFDKIRHAAMFKKLKV